MSFKALTKPTEMHILDNTICRIADASGFSGLCRSQKSLAWYSGVIDFPFFCARPQCRACFEYWQSDSRVPGLVLIQRAVFPHEEEGRRRSDRSFMILRTNTSDRPGYRQMSLACLAISAWTTKIVRSRSRFGKSRNCASSSSAVTLLPWRRLWDRRRLDD